MAEIISLLYVKFKLFFTGLVTGAVFHYFEIQVNNGCFNLGKFIVSSVIFGVLTEFAHLMIQGRFIDTDLQNEARVMVVSVMLASFLYLFIPYVLKKENRSAFIESVLEKFGFTKKQ